MRPEDQRCGKCRYYDMDAVICRRYPKSRRKFVDGWCGEWAVSQETLNQAVDGLRTAILDEFTGREAMAKAGCDPTIGAVDARARRKRLYDAMDQLLYGTNPEDC